MLSTYAASTKEMHQCVGISEPAHPYLGIATPATHMYGIFDASTNKTASILIVGTPIMGILPQRPSEAAQALAPATATATSQEMFGNLSLQVLEQLQAHEFSLNPAACSVLHLLLTRKKARVRSCTFANADDGSPRIFPHTHETTLEHAGLSALTLSDAIEITTHATPLATSLNEHAQATRGENLLRVTVDLAAWRAQPRDTEKSRNKKWLFGCLLFALM
jgi:hypothetical protein